MTLPEAQERIDRIRWFHEFDFPNGLKARSRSPGVEWNRKVWTFIRTHLDRLDLSGKTVLDLGCWDGYWSFYAETRGARSVLAADDRTQNWGGSAGILLAKELLNSSVEVELDVSVYEVSRLRRTFDVIFCLGVYYHLVDPFHALAQIRHCCHPETVVVFEGDETRGLPATALWYDLSDPRRPTFIPTRESFAQMLGAAYFDVVARFEMFEPGPAWREWLRSGKDALRRTLNPDPLPKGMNRVLTVCRPFERANPLHAYRPPFGLSRYDDRFREDVPAPDTVS
jgi:tRNA (mo5U34)-methyltransferase